MNIERTSNLETSEQRTKALKYRILGKIENMADADKISEALDLALVLHSDQRARSDSPYVDHILRGVDRLLSLGVTDSDTLIASIFHDSIEDQSQKL